MKEIIERAAVQSNSRELDAALHRLSCDMEPRIHLRMSSLAEKYMIKDLADYCRQNLEIDARANATAFMMAFTTFHELGMPDTRNVRSMLTRIATEFWNELTDENIAMIRSTDPDFAWDMIDNMVPRKYDITYH